MSDHARWGLWLALAAIGCQPPVASECGEFDEVFVWVDADGDTYGGDEPIGYTCAPAAGEATNNADCDDANPDVHPNAEEVCDLLDNDCNTRIDETTPTVPWYHDSDGDGFGSEVDVQNACTAPGPDWILVAGDCDDLVAEVNPAALEICNDGIDDDCDTLADDGDGGVDPTTYTRFHIDEDGDGYGDDLRYVERCVGPQGATTQGGDCDDSTDRVHPAANEECDRIDNDCDALVDDEDDSIDPATQQSFFADADGDGYGDPYAVSLACEPTPGIGVSNDLDCDDSDPLANVDQDWYVDTDQDGSGAGASVAFQCLNPGAGTAPAANGVDCEPEDASVFPQQIEVCDDVLDQDCDARVDCDDPDCAADAACPLPCSDRVVDTYPYGTNGNTMGTGNNMGPLTCAFSNAPELVFEFVPPTTGVYTINTFGSIYDTVLYVREGCSNTEVACNDNSGGGTQSQVQVNLTAGVKYAVVVDGYSGGFGAFTLNIQ